MKEKYITDLDIENFMSDNKAKNVLRNKACGDITVIDGSIKTKAQELKYGKSIGEYISIYTKRPLDDEYDSHALEMTVSKELKRLVEKYIGKKIDTNTSLLVVGIGNKSIASDSLGVLTADKIHVNRHIKGLDEKMFLSLNSCSLSAFIPGVYGNTGINTVDLVSGVIRETSPDCLLVVDSLVSTRISFLGAMLQISDGGISPGSGVDNERCEISKQTVGVPVISLGVPFVTDSFSVISGALASSSIENENKKLFEKLRRSNKTLITLNNCEALVNKWSDVLAESIEEICVL